MIDVHADDPITIESKAAVDAREALWLWYSNPVHHHALMVRNRCMDCLEQDRHLPLGNLWEPRFERFRLAQSDLAAAIDAAAQEIGPQ